MYANLFALPVGKHEADVKLNSFVVGSTPAGNLTATPATQPVTTGTNATVNLAWNNLAAGTRYLGVLSYTRREQQPDRQDAGLAELTEVSLVETR